MRRGPGAESPVFRLERARAHCSNRATQSSKQAAPNRGSSCIGCGSSRSSVSFAGCFSLGLLARAHGGVEGEEGGEEEGDGGGEGGVGDAVAERSEGGGGEGDWGGAERGGRVIRGCTIRLLNRRSRARQPGGGGGRAGSEWLRARRVNDV